MTGTNAAPRVPLSRDRILQTALELVDDRGIESLTMRKLGRALGFEAMSLYNHVTDKDDVLDGILDLVLSEIERPLAAGDWVEAVRRSAISVHEALRRHPWASGLMMSPAHIRPARVEYMDALLGRLREAGFSAETTYHAYHVLDAHIIGFTLWASTHGSVPADIEDIRGFLDRMIPAETYPHLHEHGMQHLEDGPHQNVTAFEYGLDLVLDSLERLRS